MSRYVAAKVYRKRIGSMAKKAILAYCAERANDDGSGIWPSKSRVAREVECSKQTVIDTFKAFVLEGLLIELGRRRTGHGYVVEYAMNMPAIEALPNALEDEELTGPDLDRSNQLTPRGQATGPQGVKPVDPNRPLTVPEPSLFMCESETSSSQSKSTTADVGAQFDEFWNIYPIEGRKSKKAARAKFAKAVKDGTSAEFIIAAAKRYAKWLVSGRPGEFRPQAKNALTWLNQGCWDDELPGAPATSSDNPEADRLEREADLSESMGSVVDAVLMRARAALLRGATPDLDFMRRLAHGERVTGNTWDADRLERAIEKIEARRAA